MEDKKYEHIISHYEACLEKHGDTHAGVDWPRKEDAETRYRIMLDVIRPHHASGISLLDFGCGASHLYEYILRNDVPYLEYSGLDLSEKFVSLSRSKFPAVNYYHLDILEDPGRLPAFDYVVLNGVFTEKQDLAYPEMLTYAEAVIQRVFEKTRVGMAFNVMSKQVDWERDDLFHVPFDTIATFLTTRVSRHFLFRHDYGLYEYTVYVYRQPDGVRHAP